LPRNGVAQSRIRHTFETLNISVTVFHGFPHIGEGKVKHLFFGEEMMIYQAAGTAASSRKNRRLAQALAFSVIAASLGSGISAWADTYGNNGGTLLSSPGSWIDETTPANSGLFAPGSADIAAFDFNAGLVSPTSFALGAPTSWLGLLIQNPGAGITIGADGNTLTLGASGIDMSNASQSLTLAGPVVIGASQTWNVDASQSLADSSTVDLGATGTVLTFAGAGNKSFSGILSDAGGITKTGPGKLTLTNANTYTGNTSITAGTLLLDFSSLTTTTNIVSSGSILNVGGATVNINGNASTATSQTFASTNFTAGTTAFNLVNNGAVNTVNLNAVTRTTGSGVNFVVPANAVLESSTGTASTILLVNNAAFATVNGTDWAAKDSTNAFIVAGSTVPGFYTANLIDGAGSAVTLTGNIDMSNPTGTTTATETRISTNNFVTSVRFNNPNTPTTTTESITVKAGSFLATGGVLVTPNVGTTNTNIDAVRSNAGGSDLVVWQNNPLGTLTFGSVGSNSSNVTSQLTKNGVGTLIIGAAGNYAGQTFVNGGIVSINTDGAIGAVATAAALNLNGGTLQATATFPLSNGAVGTNDRPIAIGTNNGGIDVTGTNVFTVAGVVSGVGSLTKSNTGTLILSGNSNTYTGGTVVTGGTLRVDNTSGSATGTGAVTFNGGTLSGIGTISGLATLNSGSALIPGDVGVGKLNVGSLTLNAGSASTFFLSGPSTVANPFQISSTGTLTINGSNSVSLFQPGTTTAFATAGTYDLGTLGSGGTVGSVTNFTVADVAPSTTYTFGSSGGFLTLTIASSLANSAWAADVSGQWGTASNWTPAVVPTNAGDVATFPTNLGSSNVTVTMVSNRTVGTLVFGTAGQSSPFSYTIAAGGGTLTMDNGSNAASITDLGGSHVIATPVTLTKTITINASNDTVSGAASVLTFAGNISDSTGSGTVIVNGTGTVIFSGTNTYSGTTTINAGATLQLGSGGTAGSFGAGAVTNNGNLLINRTDTTPVIFTNAIGGSGGITLSGTAIVQLAGTDTYTGPITINGGTLQVSPTGALSAAAATNTLTMASGTTFDLNGSSVTIASLSGAGVVDNKGATNAILTTGSANASPTFSGVIQNSGVGTLALTKNGTGLLTLSGINTYTGGTVINAGGILITNGSGFGTGTIQANTATAPTVGAGSIQLSDGITLSNPIVTIGNGSNEILGIASGTATVASNITTTGSTQYRVGTAGGTLIMTGTSKIGIASSNTSLLSILTRGTLLVEGTGSITNLFQAMTIGRQSSTSTLNLTIQDNAVVQGVGVNLDGLNSTNDDSSVTVMLTGNALLSAGTGAFSLNNSNTTGTTTLSVAGNSTVAGSAFTQTGTNEGGTNVTFDGGTLLATGGDTATPFLAASTTEASFVVSNVTVQNTYSPSINIATGGMKVNDGGFAITIAATLGTANGADGGLTKLGNGSLTLTGSNGYTGNTTVTSGSLFVDAPGATSTGFVVLNGGTLGGNGSIYGSVVAGSGAHTINPGATGPNSIGTLSIGGNLTTTANTTLAFDLNLVGGTSDLLAVSGNVSLGSGGKLAITSATTGSGSLGYYKVLSYGGTLTGSTSSIVLPAVVGNISYTLDSTHDLGFIDVHRGFLGDANDSGTVDVTDLNLVLSNLGTKQSSWSAGNFDGAATIDLTDLNDVLNNLGNSAAGTSTVSPPAAPEPASLSLLALGAAALIARRRKA
jgi:fibronectin-binding autotransporter adhesin